MADWTIEPFAKENSLPAARLSESYYGKDDDTADQAYLEYEYWENPLGRAVSVVAWNSAKKEAAGTYALIPTPVKTGSQTRRCLLSVNSLTSERYRGQGIYTAMITDAYQSGERAGYSLVYGMPNQNSYPIHRKCGLFQDLGPIPLYLRPLRPSGMAHSYVKSGALSALARPFDGLYRPRSSAGTLFVKLTNENLDFADRFWERVKDKYPVMVSRDGRRLAWRFLNIPRRKYQCWYALSANGAPVAFAIGRKMEVAGIRCAMLADLLFLDGYESQARALVRKVLGILREEGADMAGCLMLPWTSEAALLRKMGFFKCPKAMEPQPFLFCAHAFQDEIRESGVMELKNWFFTMGDYDVV